MKFRNVWIDPRVTRATPAQVASYLNRQGWKLSGPADNALVARYEKEGVEDAPTLFVPAEVSEGAALEWLLEVVEDLARFEGRWAVSVLDDILRQPAGVNGAAHAPSEHAPR